MKPIGTSFEAVSGQMLLLVQVLTMQPTFTEDLCCFLLRDALDLLENPTWGISYGFDGVETAINHELDITLRQASNALDT